MDMFKQKRNLIVTIVILVIINLTTLLLLWLGKPKHNFNRGPETGVGEKVHIQKLLNEELGFTNEQAKKYIDLRQNHRKVFKEINSEIKELKGQMFDDVLMGESSPVLSDSLLQLTLEKQGQLEKLTFQHFVELKNLCNSGQQKKLQLLMHNLIGPPRDGSHEGPRPGKIPDGPPPGEFREGHPPPPPRNRD